MIPVSTYRIQFNKEFTFRHLENIIDYLVDLGVQTIYASPIFTAVPGSMHGYDVTDPHSINPEIGTIDELRVISKKLRKKGIGWLQDIVPNHMAFSRYNFRLMDVLERGMYSSFYTYFDVNWQHHNSALKGKLMIPFLGDTLEKLIHDKSVQLLFTDDGFLIQYYENVYPVNAKSLKLIAFHMKNKSSEFLQQVTSLLDNSTAYNEYAEKKKSVFKQVSELFAEEINQAIAAINEHPEALFEIMNEQYYILVPHYETNHVINYRRFFTVNDLICLRMEDEKVFNEYHQFIHQLFSEEIFTGLRVDHIDGLHNPEEYINGLRMLFGNDCYIIAEKILEHKEVIPSEWKIQGTSGYEFLSYTNQLLTSSAGAMQMKQLYHDLKTSFDDYDLVVEQNKKRFLLNYMKGELNNLVHLLFDYKLIDTYDENIVKESMAEFMVAFPVYRIYATSLPLSKASLEIIEEAGKKAIERKPHVKQVMHALADLFKSTEPKNEHHLYWINRFSQFTGPLAAKGVEDTTFYNYNVLISHNEVGDAPCMLGISVDDFHEKMKIRSKSNPHSINTTSTHDTKRGEDGRLRINLLAENPDLWKTNVQQWMQLNHSFKKNVGGNAVPVINDEYFLYQTLVNGYPENGRLTSDCVERLKAYFQKVLREAKVNTSWSDVNDEYENACSLFIDNIVKDDSAFMQQFSTFMQELLHNAWKYYLVQALIKFTAPGIPDIYQGTEFPDLSYVDPDNRRPINYQQRMEVLQKIKQNSVNINELNSSEKKLWLIHKLLAIRNAHPVLFQQGAYIPLAKNQSDVLAFKRCYNNEELLVIANLSASKNQSIQLDETIFQSGYYDVFNGFKRIESDFSLKNFPVMLCVNKSFLKKLKASIVISEENTVST